MRFMAARNSGRICLFGAPFDSTTSYRPGSRFAPSALREASYGLETYSPIQDADLADVSFMDSGDMELPFGDPTPGLAMIRQETAAMVAEGRIPFLLGGEHLVSLGAVQACLERFPGLKIIHLDAHADLREEYLGQRLSHATVMRRIGELTGFEAIRQIGIRSMDMPERDLVASLKGTVPEIITWAGASPCYLTCDLDILDPSVFPGTGTPEPGGLGFIELLMQMLELIRHLTIVGMDIVELAPTLDTSGVSAVVAAKIVRECLIALAGSADYQLGR